MAFEIIFAVSVAILAYTYVGYPVVLFVLSISFGKRVLSATITPSVSLIIAARNEERDIAGKIENTLALDYPRDKLEIIVASDCSTDRTDEIVRNFAGRGVVLQRPSVRLGKTAAQNQAVRLSSGHILVFSDATTRLSPDAVTRIARSFADPTVGCVAGQLVYEDPATSVNTGIGQGCQSYWSLEKQIRTLESRLGSLIGVSGCLYAVRRSCHRRIAADMIDDFVIALEIHLQGLRTVYDSDAVASEHTNRRSSQEFRMRVRVIEQTITAVHRYWPLLGRKRTMFRFQLVSHKLLRYTAPLFLMTAYFSNLLLVNDSRFYVLSFAGMTLFYLSASIGSVLDRLGYRMGPLTIPYYFALANVASIVAFARFACGNSRVVWEPVREPLESSPR